MRECLHGFAQAHVVGEDAAEIEFAQKLQPVEPPPLIVAQCRAQPGGRRDRLHPRKAAQPFREGAQPLAAQPAQPCRGLDLGERDGLAHRDADCAGGRQVLGMEQFDEGGEDCLGAVERERDMSAIFKTAEHNAADRDRVDAAVQVAHAAQQRSQHRQQLHPFATDLDAEIERKPPSASLGYRRVPVAVAGNDARAELRIDFDAPAVPLQRGHGAVNKTSPRRRVVIEAEREQLALALHLREVGRRQQPACGEPPVKGGLRRIMAPPHDDAPVLDMAQLGGRGSGVDDPAVVLVAEEGDVDTIVAAAGAERVPIGSPAGREAQHRDRRLAADFLDQFGPRRRQAKARETPRQRLASAAAWFGATGGAARNAAAISDVTPKSTGPARLCPGSTYQGAAQGRISPSPSASRASTA